MLRSPGGEELNILRRRCAGLEAVGRGRSRAGWGRRAGFRTSPRKEKRPIRKVRMGNSRDSTQADSYIQGANFPPDGRRSPKFSTRDSRRRGLLPCGPASARLPTRPPVGHTPSLSAAPARRDRCEMRRLSVVSGFIRQGFLLFCPARGKHSDFQRVKSSASKGFSPAGSAGSASAGPGQGHGHRHRRAGRPHPAAGLFIIV